MADDAAQVLRELLASLQVTVLCHPDQLEAVQAAAEEAAAGVVVYPSPGVPAGHLVTMQPKVIPLQPGPRRRRDDWGG